MCVGLVTGTLDVGQLLVLDHRVDEAACKSKTMFVYYVGILNCTIGFLLDSNTVFIFINTGLI